MAKNDKYILADESLKLDPEMLSRLKPARRPITQFPFGSATPITSVDPETGEHFTHWMDHNGNEI